MSRAATRLSSVGTKKSRHQNTLEDDLVAAGPLRTKSKKRKARREDDAEGYVDSRSSRKILRIGQELVEEEEEKSKPSAPNTAFNFDSRFGSESEAEEEARHEDEEAWGDEDEEEIDGRVQEFLISASWFL